MRKKKIILWVTSTSQFRTKQANILKTSLRSLLSAFGVCVCCSCHFIATFVKGWANKSIEMENLIGTRLYFCFNCRNHVAVHDDVISKTFQVNTLSHLYLLRLRFGKMFDEYSINMCFTYIWFVFLFFILSLFSRNDICITILNNFGTI